MFYSVELLCRKGVFSVIWAAGSRAGRVLSKKTVNEQAIAKLCHSVLFPQAELALRLRAVLLQGIVVIYSRQTLYLMKDCKDALKSFHDALHKPQSAQINLSDAVGTLKDLTRPALLPSSDVDFFVDASDMMLVEAQNEAARGQQNENPDLELVLADPYSQLSIRRDDITLREDESMSGFVVGDPAAGQGEELLGGFDFPFDGNVELEHDHNQQQQQLADAPLLPSADEVERNELLDQVNFDDSNSTPAQHVRRKRERAMPADSKTRIEASVLRNWLQADRATAIARPELAVVSVHSGPSANPRSLNLTGICSELQGFFAEISDVPADAEESSEFKRGRMSSVEQGRADEEDGGIVAMDMGWDDALMAGNQNPGQEEDFGRASEGRLPSVSPRRPGRSSIFSDHSSDAEVAGFALAVASPEQQQQQQNEDVGDSRTFKLKALMRKRFDENPEISFQSFTTGVRSTKAFVNTFYHLLILASAGQLRFEQPEPYGDISITKTISF